MTAEATVLIVDDEVRARDSLERLLAMDYRVLRAEPLRRPGVETTTEVIPQQPSCGA